MQLQQTRLRLAQAILDLYGYSNVLIEAPRQGYRNQSFKVTLPDGHVLNLMIFKAEAGMTERITRADAAAQVLTKQGLPVRTRVDERLVKVQAKYQSHATFAALYNYLSGEAIAWEAYTQDHIKLLGATLSAVHNGLGTAPQELVQTVAHEASVYNQLYDLLEKMEGYLGSTEVANAMADKLAVTLKPWTSSFKDSIQEGSLLKEQQLLHMDFVRGNILFTNNGTNDQRATVPTLGAKSITGIIDFEKVSYGHPLFDIARTLAFLLVDCKYKTSKQIRKYFLYSGYIKRGDAAMSNVLVTASGSSKNLLEIYVRLFLLHDFYKFLKHNPYESLSHNEHYARTRDILHFEGMLEYKQ